MNKLQIFKGKLSGQWLMQMPGRKVPGGYEPANTELLDIRAYQQWLRLLNKGWRVRSTA